MTMEEMFKLLNCNSNDVDQERGMERARTVNVLSFFFQPDEFMTGYNNYKDVWNNCAIILSEKSDEELEPYLVKLFDWLKDMNDPGSKVIKERLMKYKRNSIYLIALELRLNKAKKLHDTMWENNLKELFTL